MPNFCFLGELEVTFPGWLVSDNKAISVQLDLTGTGTELGNNTHITVGRLIYNYTSDLIYSGNIFSSCRELACFSHKYIRFAPILLTLTINLIMTNLIMTNPISKMCIKICPSVV